MRLALGVLLLSSIAWAGSSNELISAVRDALHARKADSEIARLVTHTKLTDRLDPVALEVLQSEGAGALTLEGLDRQSELSRSLPQAAAPTKLFDAPPPPTTELQAKLIDEARAAALQYSATLPNFICTQTVHRFNAPKSLQWKPRDTLEVDVAMSEKTERYKLLTVNHQPTTKTLQNVGGFKSSGEFGTLLLRIFEPKSETTFVWDHWTKLRGRLTHVFTYRIEQARSTYQLDFRSGFKRYRMTSGMRGQVYLDAETNTLLRFSAEADRLPADWPILRTPSVLDYELADVGGHMYLLPKRVDTRVVLRDGQSRNLTDFANYRKFSADATLTFEKQ